MNEPKFIIIPEFVDKNKNLNSGEKILAGRIYALASKRGYCFASNAMLAEDRDISVREVERRINKLVKQKIFTRRITKKGKIVTERRLYAGNWEPTKPSVDEGNQPTKLSQPTDQTVGRPTDQNGGGSSRVVSSRVTSRVSPKGDRAKAQFGNSEINKILDCLKNELGGVPIDGTQKENRQYANSFLSKLKKMCKDQGQAEDRAADLGCFIISAAHKGWHTKNATNMKYIFYNMGKIIQQTKQGKEIASV